MAKMMGPSTKRSSHDDKPLNTPSKGMMVRDSEKVLGKMPPHRDSGTAALVGRKANEMDDPRVLEDSAKYLRNMHHEKVGMDFDKAKSIHDRIANAKEIDRVEDQGP